MKTLQLIQDRKLQIPMTVSWYLSDIGESQGLQALSQRQSPQRWKVDNGPFVRHNAGLDKASP